MNSIFLKEHFQKILIAIIVLMTAAIMYLLYENQRLTEIINDPKKYFRTVEAEKKVPSIRTQDIYGNNVSLRYSASEPHTFLFWFSPNCSSCEENLAYWNNLYLENNSKNIRFLGMCACNPVEARQLVEEYDLKFSVTCANDPFITETYHGKILPQTVFITPIGLIKKVWPGSLTDWQKEEINAEAVGVNTLTMEGGE